MYVSTISFVMPQCIAAYESPASLLISEVFNTSISNKPEFSKPLYLFFNQELRKEGVVVEEGIFGADMKIDLLNDGPVTIIMDSREL